MSAPPRFVSGLPDPPGSTSIHRAAWTRHSVNTGTAFRAIYALATHLPRPVARGLARSGTEVAWRTMPDTRSALRGNFAGAFPDLSAEAADTLAHRTFHSYAADVLDLIRAVPLSPDASLDLFEDVAGQGAPFLEALDGGKGVILVTGHFGNWEIGGALMRALRLPMTVLAMREADDELNRIRVDYRRRFGADTIEVRQSMDTALQIRRRLAENRIVAMLMDRHVDRDRVAVTFFGRRAWFLRTPPLLAYMTGAPLLPCSVVRTASGQFRVRPGRAIHVSRELERDVAVQQAAQAFATQLEACVRETPHCWYQFYPYWATQDAVAD
jgi:KDO2-lipid IV(A) lauroyltransferase